MNKQTRTIEQLKTMRMRSAHLAVFLACLVWIGVAIPNPVRAQSDTEVRQKQKELKEVHTEVQTKQIIVEEAAKDKPRPTTSRRRRGFTSTGYDYTQVKGFTLRAYHDRLDELFKQAYELKMFEDEYRKDGTFPVPGRKGVGSAQIRAVEIYYAESTPEEQENEGAPPFELLEIRIIKNEQLPPEEMGAEGAAGETGLFGLGGSSGETIVKAFDLAGSKLWSMINLLDPELYDDILARRSQEPSIALPADVWYPEKRGPFVVQGKNLEFMKGRFNSFWNPEDTVVVPQPPAQEEAPGPIVKTTVPIYYPENIKIRIKNQNGQDPLKISSASFIGETAGDWRVTTKLPVVLKPKGEDGDRFELKFEYVGESPYETMGYLKINAPEAKMTQILPIVANPGKKPSDVAVLDFSLFGIELRSPARASFAPNWTIKYRLGNDEINAPLWASGMSALMVGYKNDMHLGLILPMNMVTPDMPTPLALNHGLLNSPMGYTLDFDFSFGFPFALTGDLSVTDKFDGDAAYSHMKVLDKVVDLVDYTNDFFYYSTIARLAYPLMFVNSERNPTFSFRVEVGGGYVQVQRAHVVMPGETSKVHENNVIEFDAGPGTMYTLGKENEIVDVFFSLSFINMGATNPYGMGIQYFNGGIMASAWLDLTEWFRVEAKYAFLLRGREIWEQEPSYFQVSPRFRFGFPSIFN